MASHPRRWHSGYVELYQIVSTGNYSSPASSCTLLLTTACVLFVFTICSLRMDAVVTSSTQIVTSQHLLCNWPLAPNVCVLEVRVIMMTDGQWSSIWGPRPDFCYCQLWVCRCGTPFLMRRWACNLQLLPALTSTIILTAGSHRTHGHILRSQIWDSSNLEGQVPVFISPRNRMVQLHTQTLGSLYVAPYDSQRVEPLGNSALVTALHFLFCYVCIYCHGTVFTVPLPRNAHLFWLHYPGFSPPGQY
jgi:hypothetical protein